MKISIISFESTVGRTFISLGLFHAALSRKNGGVQLMGYDIEKPDLIQFFPGVKFEASEVYASFPRIDKNHCKFCGACIHYCHTGALKLNRNIPAVITDPDKCEACGECVDGCNIRGIGFKERLTGYLLQGRHSHHLITVGQAEDSHDFTLPLICTLNRHMMPEKSVISDLGPGINGKVKLALKDSDLAIVVIKPGTDWEFQLEEMMAGLNLLGIRPAILLNQVEGFNDEVDQIKMYALKHKIPLPGIIPLFNSIRIENITDFNSGDTGLASIFAAVWDQIPDFIGQNSQSL